MSAQQQAASALIFTNPLGTQAMIAQQQSLNQQQINLANQMDPNQLTMNFDDCGSNDSMLDDGGRNSGNENEEEKRFVCPHPGCNKSYTRNSRLRFHQRNAHLNQVSYYRCQFCGLKFLEKGNLKVHIRRHTGEKPYSCKYCGAQFSTSGNRNDHERRHLKLKSYSCQDCGKKFYRKCVLLNHEQKCPTRLMREHVLMEASHKQQTPFGLNGQLGGSAPRNALQQNQMALSLLGGGICGPNGPTGNNYFQVNNQNMPLHMINQQQQQQTGYQFQSPPLNPQLGHNPTFGGGASVQSEFGQQQHSQTSKCQSASAAAANLAYLYNTATNTMTNPSTTNLAQYLVNSNNQGAANQQSDPNWKMMASSTSLTNIFEGMQASFIGSQMPFATGANGTKVNGSTCDLSHVINGGGILGASSSSLMAHSYMGNNGAAANSSSQIPMQATNNSLCQTISPDRFFHSARDAQVSFSHIAPKSASSSLTQMGSNVGKQSSSAAEGGCLQGSQTQMMSMAQNSKSGLGIFNASQLSGNNCQNNYGNQAKGIEFRVPSSTNLSYAANSGFKKNHSSTALAVSRRLSSQTQLNSEICAVPTNPALSQVNSQLKANASSKLGIFGGGLSALAAQQTNFGTSPPRAMFSSGGLISQGVINQHSTSSTIKTPQADSSHLPPHLILERFLHGRLDSDSVNAGNTTEKKQQGYKLIINTASQVTSLQTTELQGSPCASSTGNCQVQSQIRDLIFSKILEQNSHDSSEFNQQIQA